MYLTRTLISWFQNAENMTNQVRTVNSKANDLGMFEEINKEKNKGVGIRVSHIKPIS